VHIPCRLYANYLSRVLDAEVVNMDLESTDSVEKIVTDTLAQLLNPSHRSLPFFFRTDYVDSPDCLLLLLSISVFYFLVLHFFSCRFRAVD